MKDVAGQRILRQAGAHPFAQTAKESTSGMIAKKKENMQMLALLLPTQAMPSFENMASYEASKEHLTPSAVGWRGVESSFSMDPPASKCIVLGKAATQVHFTILLSSRSS